MNRENLYLDNAYEEILDVYFTSPERLIPFLKDLDKEEIINCLADVINRYANDVNSSGLRELYTLIKAQYRPTPGKLGYNGEEYSGRPCDVKPINKRSDSKKKLNGGGNFSDFTYERLDRYLADKVAMLVSGFVDGQLVYILEFPFSSLENHIRGQLDRFFTAPRRPGEYLRSASFSFVHYKDSAGLKVIYSTLKLNDFKQFLTRKLFLFLGGE